MTVRQFDGASAIAMLADAAAFLLTNGYVNGEVMRLDGAQRFSPK